MSDIEVEVRKMLERRAADIEDRDLPGGSEAQTPSSAGLPATTGRRWPAKPLLAVAGIVAIVAGGAALVTARWPAGSNDGIVEAVADTSTESTAPEPTEQAAGSGQDATGSSTNPPRSLASVLEDVPAAVDLVEGPLIFVSDGVEADKDLARRYLDDRLPLVAYELEAVERDGAFSLLRWRVGEQDVGLAGSLVIRRDDFGLGVVLATTDEIDVQTVERSIDQLGLAFGSTNDNLLAVDVVTLDGSVVDGAPNPDGVPDTGGPPFGTAAFRHRAGTVEADLAVEPIAVIVRAQHVGGTFVSISEFALDVPGFSEPCGAEAPLSIDVGDLLAGLTDGPSALSETVPLVNQRVWNHEGATASIEIIWPADPVKVRRAGQLEFGNAVTFMDPEFDPSQETGNFSNHVLAAAGQAVSDPCSIVQISIHGEPAAVDWWSTAISAEYTFGLPLTIAELDPAVGPLGSDGSEAPTELIIGSARASAPPRVPETGSCDGLPDAPPDAGPGPADGVVHEQPADALRAFVAEGAAIDAVTEDGEPIELYLWAAGYTEVQIDESWIAYVVDDVERPVIVIEVERGDRGWTVTRWETAAC